MTSHSPEGLPSFFQRLPIALGAFISVLSSPSFARQVLNLRQMSAGSAPSAPVAPVASAAQAMKSPAPSPVAPPPMKDSAPDSALQLLGLLQRDARLIDFTQEDLSHYSDADIGGVARVLHEGCCKVLRDHFTIAPARTEAEGSRVTLPAGFDARAVRLTGHVVGQAPFSGTLCHRGWRATEVRLPKLASGHDVNVLAQAEVEL